MTWEQVQTTIVGVAVSAVVALFGRYFGVKMTSEHRNAVQWAIEQGIALAASKLTNKSGEEKKAAALETAKSLAPKAFSELKLTDETKSTIVDATYARMKASLPSTTFISHGDALEYQTERVERK